MGRRLFLLLLLQLHSGRSAPISAVQIEHPDPLRVYIVNEISPENIRNDQFFVRLATHVPPLRPNEIPYFPPIDGLLPEEEYDVKTTGETGAGNTLVANEPEDSPETSTEEDKYGLGDLPPNIDLKPESIAEMILSSTIDKEEMVTNKPPEEGDAGTEENSTMYDDTTTMTL